MNILFLASFLLFQAYASIVHEGNETFQLSLSTQEEGKLILITYVDINQHLFFELQRSKESEEKIKYNISAILEIDEFDCKRLIDVELNEEFVNCILTTENGPYDDSFDLASRSSFSDQSSSPHMPFIGPTDHLRFAPIMARLKSQKYPHSEFFFFHCQAMLYGWCLISFLIIMSGRYVKYYTNIWRYFHFILGGGLTLFTLILSIISLSYKGVNGPDMKYKMSKAHLAYAIILLIFALVACGNGFYLYRLKNNPKSKNKLRFTMKIIHKLMGYSTIGISMMQCHNGILIKYKDFYNKYHSIYYAYIGLFCLCEICFAYFLHKTSWFGPQKLDSQKLRTKDAYNYIKEELRKGRRILIFEDSVIDYNRFIKAHPGDFMEELMGKEIARYIYGGLPYKGYRHHRHTNIVYDLLSSIEIGRIYNHTRRLLFVPNGENVRLNTTVWQLVERNMISQVHARFRFVSPFINTRGFIPGLSHIGKYFTLFSFHHGLSRHYTSALAMNPTLYLAHTNLINAYDRGDTTFIALASDPNQYFKNGIEIYVKKMFLLSKWLHEGEGLNMNSDIGGTVIALGAGCGAILFTDLCAYIIRKTIYDLGVAEKKLSYKIFENEKFEDLMNESFKFIFFGSFVDRDQALGVDLYEAFAQFNKKHGLDTFKYYVRLDDIKDPFWSGGYFTEKFNPADISRAFITAPPPLDGIFRKTLCGIGIDNTRIQDV